MALRPYQKEAVDSVFKEWDEGRRKTLLVQATGTGKTVVFSSIADVCNQLGENVMILAHRGELLQQAIDKMKAFAGIDCALEKAESTAIGSPIIVASMQTLTNEKRLNAYPSNYFDTIIVDEAHHVMSDGYQKIMNHFPNAKVLGCTATADRGDRKSLGKYFDSMAYEYSLPQAIRDGYLSPLKAMTIPLNIDISNVKLSEGDYALGDLDHALDPYLEQIADEMANICKDKHTVVFLPLIETSKKFCQLLNVRGLSAAEVNGQSPDRDEILTDFANRKYQVLCNSMLLTEGWDCPIVDCIVCLRPTKVRSLYSQMIGRGTRLYPGKDHLLILDFLWMTSKHDLCRPASLFTTDEDVAKKASKRIQEEPQDLTEEFLAQCEKDVLMERENALAAELRKQRNKKRGLVDPLQYAFSIMDTDLTNYEPSFGFESLDPTDKQIDLLAKFGINGETVTSRGQASAIISAVMERKKNKLSTPKQIRFLESRGFMHVGEWTNEQASKMITRISNNRWMVPFGINPREYRP